MGLNSGYDALHMSLRAAGIGSGDEVIVPAHTFVATCSAVVNVGATPVLVDVGKDFNIDCDLIEEAHHPTDPGHHPGPPERLYGRHAAGHGDRPESTTWSSSRTPARAWARASTESGPAPGA